MILDSTSLVKTIDNINERFLFGEPITEDEGLEASRWIASRQGETGHYRSMFAPTQSDFEHGMHLFTGEKLVCASGRHIMGQEAARAAWLLGNEDPSVMNAYHRATDWMQDEPGFLQSGTFCCGRCTLAFWRHARVGYFKDIEKHITTGMQMMKDHRKQGGEWSRFPFFYAVYTLMDLDLDPAYNELKHALPVMERYVKNKRVGIYSQRRVAIIRKALEKIN